MKSAGGTAHAERVEASGEVPRQPVILEYKFTLLSLTILVGVMLRIWGLDFGLPYTYHYDEHFFINTALKLGAGVLNNPPYAATGFSNILFGEYGLYYVLGRLFGSFTSSDAFQLAFRRDPTVFYVLGRLTTAVLGTATILALYVLGSSASGVTAGLAAAILLSVSFLHIRDCHYAVPDVAMSFFVAVAIALAAVALRNGNRRYIIAASFIGGLAVAMKWTGLPVALPVGWGAIRVQTARERVALRDVPRSLAQCAAFFLLGFALGSPEVILNPAPYVREALRQHAAGQAGGFEIWQVDTLPGWMFYGKTLLYGLGPLLLAAGIVGVIRRLILVMRAYDGMSILLLGFPLSYYVLMGSTNHYFARYALPLVPFATLFAAEAFVVLSPWAKARWGKLGSWLMIVLAGASVVQPLGDSIRHDILLTREDTRTLAKKWIEGHIPAATRIAVDWPVHGPPLSTEEKSMPHSEKVYSVVEIGGSGLSGHDLNWYRERFDYLVTSSFIHDIPLLDRALNLKRNAFYSALDEELVRVREFKPYQGDKEPAFIFDEIYGPAISLWERERPGPTLKLYRVK